MAGTIDYRFDHVHYYCSDLVASERWFVECMGAEVTGRLDLGGATTVYLRLGDANLVMRQRRDGEKMDTPNSPHLGTDHVGFVVDDLDAVAAELKARGVQFTRDPQQFLPGVRIAFLLGPDNVSIELMERKP
ncbi:MAG: VOC family protein [Chloroflexota bacterium]